MHPDMCENPFLKSQPGLCVCVASSPRFAPLVRVTLLGSRAAGTCASLTGKFGSTPPSFSPICYLDGGTRRAGEARVHTNTCGSQTCTSRKTSNSPCENFSRASSALTQMFLLAPRQVAMGRHRGPLWGLWGGRGPNRASESG